MRIKSNYYYTRVRPKLKRMVRALGVKPSRSVPIGQFPPDFDDRTIRIVNRVNEFTMTGPERLQAFIYAVRYVVENGIQGSIVECGVWRGGSMMAAALTLKELGDESRDLYLYDTYEGMSAPTEADGQNAIATFAQRKLSADTSDWCRSPREEVEQNLVGTGYPREKLHFIQGKVEDSLPAYAPVGPIAILRLDTDWYESTRQELLHLYPKLVSRGVLIIDDYDTWQGSRAAVDEFLAAEKPCLLLNRIDFAARIAVKP